MPRLPSVDDVGRANLAASRAPAIAAPRDASGAALEQAGKVVTLFNEKQVEAQRATALSTANVEAQRRLKELEFGFNDDQDFATFQTRFEAARDEIRSEISERLQDSAVQSAFQAQFDKSSLVAEFNVRKLARTRQIDHGQASLTRNMDTFGEMLAGADNDLDRSNIKQQAILALSDAASTGIITQEQRADREFAFLNKADTIRARRDMRADPEAFVANISDSSLYPDLTEKARQTLSEQASRLAGVKERERVRLVDRAERKADRDRKEAQALHAAQLRVDMLNDPESINEERLVFDLQRRKITLTDFESLRRGLRAQEAGEDDPNIFLALTESAINAEPSVPSRVFAAREAGLLTRETAGSILEKHAASLRRGGPLSRDDVKRARQFVDESVGGVRGPLSVLDSGASARLAGALREFDDRVLAGEEPFEVADDIVPRFRLSDPGITALPKPRYLVGTRANPDIEATMRATVEAHERKEIDDRILEEEAPLLKLYEEFIERRERQRERTERPSSRNR